MNAPKPVAFLSALLLLALAETVQGLNLLPPPRAGDRIAIIAPHPDDEVIATSGLIQQAVAVGAQVKIIYLTNGDHNQAAFKRYSQRLHLVPNQLALGEYRYNEALAATRLLGLTADDVTFLGYPDWWTLRLWQDYWEPSEVFYNSATGSNYVPYSDNFSYRQAYRADNIIEDLCDVLRTFKPTRVFATHPCDTNPDHRATANFVQLALLQLETDGLRPSLDFYIVHFGNWPTPLQYNPAIPLEPPPTLHDACDWLTLPLTREQVERKYHATLTNQTQTANHQSFLVAFARANEAFAEIRIPTVPVLPAEAALDWDKSIHVRALAVLPSQCAYGINAVAALPDATTLMSLECIDFLEQNDALIAQIELKNLTGPRSSVRLHLFAYQQGIDFVSLPKVQINILQNGKLHILVNRELDEDSGATLTNTDTRMILRIPLKLLGGTDIDHMFVSAIAYHGAQVANDTSWHLLRLQPPTKNSPFGTVRSD